MQKSPLKPLLFRCLLGLWCVVVGPALALGDSEVKNIRLGVHADHTRIVLDLSGPAGFRIEPQQRPDQIVIALEGADFDLKSAQTPAGGLVKAVRVDDRANGDCALIVDLAEPAHVSQSQQLHATGSAPARIFVDLRVGSSLPAAPAPAQAADGAPTAPDEPDTRRHPIQIASTEPVAIPQAPAAEMPEQAAEALPVAPPKPEPPAENDEIGQMVAMFDAPAVPPEKPAQEVRGHKPVIVLDAGHGGKDPGTIGENGTQEKDITLSMAKELKVMLEATGRYKVVLTRDSDVLLALRERIEVSRAAGADLFISLHADHISKTALRGASVYTLSENASDAEAASLAARENKEDLIAGVNLSSQSAMVTSILIDLAQRETKNMSARFASMLTEELSERTEMVSNSHRFAGFVVLKAPDVPSVLLELGYLSNPEDEEALGTKRHRKVLAKAIRTAIDRFFEWQKDVRRS